MRLQKPHIKRLCLSLSTQRTVYRSVFSCHPVNTVKCFSRKKIFLIYTQGKGTRLADSNKLFDKKDLSVQCAFKVVSPELRKTHKKVE